MGQIVQNAITNRLQSLAERVLWSLMTHERFIRNEMRVTHEVPLRMQGMRGASVTMAVGGLQQTGSTRTGCLAVLDPASLHAVAQNAGPAPQPTPMHALEWDGAWQAVRDSKRRVPTRFSPKLPSLSAWARATGDQP